MLTTKLLQLLNKIREKTGIIAFFLTGFLFISLITEYTFRALSSSALVCLSILTLLQPDFFKKLKSLPKNGYFFPFCLFFLFYCLYYFNTRQQNLSFFYSTLMVKAAIFILPFCLHFIPILTKKQFYLLIYLFCLVISFGALISLIYYIFNFEEVNELYLHSKVMPLPCNHVRFSMMVCTAIFSSAYLYIKKIQFRFEWEKKLQIGLFIFNILFLHILSVRSGLLSFYILLFASLFIYAFKTKKIKLALISGITSLILPFILYFAVPTIQNKITNTLDDFSKIDSEFYANTYSLSARIFTYKVGWYEFTENPFLGSGAGNLDEEIRKQYTNRYPGITNYLKPHNQYLRMMAYGGITGTIILLSCFYFPLFYKKNYKKNILLTLQYIAVSTSFLFEATLCTQYGLNYSLFLTALILWYLDSNKQLPQNDQIPERLHS